MFSWQAYEQTQMLTFESERGDHLDIDCATLYTPSCVGSFCLLRGSHFDIARAAHSSLCACWTAFISAVLIFTPLAEASAHFACAGSLHVRDCGAEIS